jgi:transposase-like protein
VTLTQTDGKSGWKCPFCQKEFADMNHTRVSSYV